MRRMMARKYADWAKTLEPKISLTSHNEIEFNVPINSAYSSYDIDKPPTSYIGFDNSKMYVKDHVAHILFKGNVITEIPAGTTLIGNGDFPYNLDKEIPICVENGISGSIGLISASIVSSSGSLSVSINTNIIIPVNSVIWIDHSFILH